MIFDHWQSTSFTLTPPSRGKVPESVIVVGNGVGNGWVRGWGGGGQGAAISVGGDGASPQAATGEALEDAHGDVHQGS